MAFELAYLEGKEAQQDRNDRRRSEKAKAFREYKDAKIANGETIDAYELDNLRMSLAGGDPFAASLIPSGDALRELTDRANEQSRLNKLKLGTDILGQKNTERTMVQEITNNYWDKSEEELSEIFASTFGDDGVRMYNQYKPELSGMLNEATQKKLSDVVKNPALAGVRDENDLYRVMPSEMRNPKMATLMKSWFKDQQRTRNMDNFKSMADVMEKTPEFVVNNPDMRAWWEDFAAQGVGYDNAASMPDGGTSLRRGLSGITTQAQVAQQGKFLELAGKDANLATALQTGDEDSIFAATRSVMFQAGLPAPTSKNDPAYLDIKRQLEVFGRTQAISIHQKREADLKASALEEGAELKKTAAKRLQGMQDAYFIGEDFRVEDEIDPRITAAMNLVVSDTSFFGSQENLEKLIGFVKQEYMADKEGFDPAVVVGKFMANSKTDNLAQWADRRVTDLMGDQGLRPGTVFPAWLNERNTKLRELATSVFEDMTRPINTQQEYDAVMNSKSDVIQGLNTEIAHIYGAINTLNNDPAKRGYVTSFDYNSGVATMRSLQEAVNALSQYNPVPPVVEQHNQQERTQATREDIMRQSRDIQNRANQIRAEADALMAPQTSYSESSSTYSDTVGAPMRVPSNARSGLDTYLDAIADAESGGDPFARAETSSAAGLFQFTKGTWSSMVERYGQAYGITEEDIFNPGAQRIMASFLTMENANQLINQTGKTPTEQDLYLAHFLGPGRASTVINHKNSGLLAANLFPDAAKANKSIFYKDGVPVTVGELYDRLGSKVTRRINNSK